MFSPDIQRTKMVTMRPCHIHEESEIASKNEKERKKKKKKKKKKKD
jgi:hypothetical protein